MKLLKISAFGKANIIEIPDEKDITDLYWKICIELKASAAGPYACCDAIDGADIMVYGVDEDVYPTIRNEYIEKIMPDEIFGSCICFAFEKGEDGYHIRGLSDEEIELIIRKAECEEVEENA